VVGEPVQQDDGSADVSSRNRGLAASGVSAGEPSAQSADHVPDGVAVQQLPFVGVLPLRDDLGDPALQPGHVLGAGRQRADRDQDAAQVLDPLAVAQLVECGVEPIASVQTAQDACGCAVERSARTRSRCHCA
jgi:hypothetical protein